MPNTKRWILLRGLARGRGHWGSFAELIQKNFSDCEFEFIDLPGNGERYQEQSFTRVTDFVKDLRAQSKFVQEGKPFNVLAVSLGAMITVEWMREFPHEVQKAVLICTSSSNFSPFYQRYQMKNYAQSFLLAFEGDPIRWEKRVLEMITNNHVRREAEFMALAQYSKQHPVQIKNIFRQLMAAAQYRFPEKAPGDIRIIGSYGDRLVSPQCSLEIGKAWGLEPIMHAWAGHDIPIDDPSWLIEYLL
ncbi:MAG TPA: alpha/beta hydrolase [Bdellovibrio sp.]|nr:alpha/beta hydrolase [Bdellovibrio sp.]